jgi:hypothetical protein
MGRRQFYKKTVSRMEAHAAKSPAEASAWLIFDAGGELFRYQCGEDPESVWGRSSAGADAAAIAA